MNLLHLAEEMGFELRKTSTTGGGEYHCPCPCCGGNDRFILWPENDRYWCRQCNVKGDAIQFCRDFQGLSFNAACTKLEKPPSDCSDFKFKKQPILLPVRKPSHTWEDKASLFAKKAHQRLLTDPKALEMVMQRGLTMDTIRENKLGWNPIKIYRRLSEWGLAETDKHQWLSLPSGIVIPTFADNSIQKLKIRKSDWKQGDPFGKYYEVPGSSNMLPIFGDRSKEVVIITEAEFDAMLVVQEAGELCNSLALGGAQKRPDSNIHEWLLKKKFLLYALDFDEAGKKAYISWKKAYPNLVPWPVPEEKSPGDYHAKKGCIREWIELGIKHCINTVK